MRLSDSVALVTGGAKRVGRAIVLELARGGCDVAVHYRTSASEAQQTADAVSKMGRRAIIVRGDLNEPESWPRIISETIDAFGRLDILVNNASAFRTDKPDTIEGFKLQQWEQMFRTNLIAPAALCHYAREHLAARGTGKIVNLCDISAQRPWPSRLSYCVSKAALEALTKGLARALAPAIQVNGVAPGIAVFPEDYSRELRERLTARVPLAREGSPEEVARLVRYLIEDGDYITGQIIPMDGGRSLV